MHPMNQNPAFAIAKSNSNYSFNINRTAHSAVTVTERPTITVTVHPTVIKRCVFNSNNSDDFMSKDNNNFIYSSDGRFMSKDYNNFINSNNDTFYR